MISESVVNEIGVKVSIRESQIVIIYEDVVGWLVVVKVLVVVLLLQLVSFL